MAKYLDASKSALFFARKVILVEGISEQLLIPEFFKIKYNENTLEQKGITLINVNGVAFSHFLEVIKAGYFIRGVAYTDSDQTRKTSERAIDLQEKYDSSITKVKITVSEPSKRI